MKKSANRTGKGSGLSPGIVIQRLIILSYSQRSIISGAYYKLPPEIGQIDLCLSRFPEHSILGKSSARNLPNRQLSAHKNSQREGYRFQRVAWQF